MGTSKFGGTYGSICGQIWAPDHDSDWNSSFGNCRRMSEHGVVKGFEQLFTIKKPKYAIEQKKRPLRVKPIMDKKNVHTVFQVFEHVQ